MHRVGTRHAQLYLSLRARGAGFTDNASVNVLPGASPGELLAVTESVPGTMRVDAATLRTLGGVAYADGVKGELNTAHPTLQRDGSIINLAIGVSHKALQQGVQE